MKPKKEQEPVNFPTHHVTRINNKSKRSLSPPRCSSSDVSSTLITSDTNDHNSSSGTSSFVPISTTNNRVESLILDEGFWPEVLSADNSNDTSSFGADLKFQFPFSPLVTQERVHLSSSSSSLCDDMDSWYDVYNIAEELPKL
ncbi:hypothetical protein RIF29_20029 [Crotalaria pallida]|uniref:Uncharacterized protein n=1 Tax=Crotalaria pallida TaxID=3830 RepID=A0AAN9F0H7_CROPI